MARSECAGGKWGGCGRVFASAEAFDKHRTGPFRYDQEQGQRRCMTLEEMEAAGLVRHPTKTDARGEVWTLEKSLHVAARLRGTGEKGPPSQRHSERIKRVS